MEGIRHTCKCIMDDIRKQNYPSGREHDALPEAKRDLSRRDFVKIAAILTGSMLIMPVRCMQANNEEPLVIPPDFKRFILVEQSSTAATEEIIVAMGSQCPDLNCALWQVSDQEFQFFESVDQIVNLYVRDGRTDLIWLD
jgi:hypothetical protein